MVYVVLDRVCAVLSADGAMGGAACVGVGKVCWSPRTRVPFLAPTSSISHRPQKKIQIVVPPTHDPSSPSAASQAVSQLPKVADPIYHHRPRRRTLHHCRPLPVPSPPRRCPGNPLPVRRQLGLSASLTAVAPPRSQRHPGRPLSVRRPLGLPTSLTAAAPPRASSASPASAWSPSCVPYRSGAATTIWLQTHRVAGPSVSVGVPQPLDPVHCHQRRPLGLLIPASGPSTSYPRHWSSGPRHSGRYLSLMYFGLWLVGIWIQCIFD